MVRNSDPEELLEALDPDQRRVAQQVGGPLAVLAGAGTGKTRAITYRVAHGAAVGAFDPQSVLALTFTTRAAAEMRQRLRDLGVPGAQARTFHSAALRQLRFFWPQTIGGTLPGLVEHKASLVAAAASRLGIRVDRTAVRDLASEIEWAKVSMVDKEHYAHTARSQGRGAPAGLELDQFSRLMDAYEVAKSERGVIDFEDVLLVMSGIMREREDVARQVRSQYRNFVVDEYQDVSALQQDLLDQWTGGRHDVCVVGDVAQTIYSFAGATPRYLTGFRERHPGANVVELNRDYRSTPQVVAVANQVMARAQAPSGGGEAPMGAVHLVSQRGMGPGVSFHTFDSDHEEARAVAARVAQLVADGEKLQSMAVLYRTNSQSEALEQAFTEAGLSVVVRGGTRFFDRDEIRRTLLLLRRMALAEPVGEEPEDAGADRVENLVDRVREAAREAGWGPEPPPGQGALRERWDNLNALVELAGERPALGLREFVADLDERVQAQAAPAIAGVTLSTLHAAKGLEWETVFLVGVAEGLLPISMAQTPSAREEERRLLYVGVTRARTRLEISWARARGEGRGRGSRTRSHFLDGIWPEEASSPRRTGRGNTPTSARGRARESAREFEESQPPEVLDLFGRLRQWRTGVAQSLGRPPYTVFTDQVLRDIAVSRPRTLKQLRAIRGIGDVKLDLYGVVVLALVRGEDVEAPVDTA